MTRRLIYLSLCSVLVAGVSHASAQTPPPASAAEPWGTLVVPGGFSALQRAIRVGGAAEEWRAIPLLIELSYAGMDGLRYLRSLETYVASLRKLRRQAAAVSPDGRVSLAGRDKNRAAFDDLLETLGLEYLSETKVVRARSAEGLELLEALDKAFARDDLATRLTAGETVSVATVDSTAPLPLGTAFWDGRFEPTPPPHDLLFAILASREMSSLYYGLLGLDDETLRAIQADSKLATALVRYALVLPAAADALRIQGGRVVPPGGAAAAVHWQDLVGEPLDRPARFVEALLRADEGRLAHFYRTMWALPKVSGHLTAAAVSSAADRGRGLRRLYDAFNSALQGWRADAMIQPPVFGPADVLAALVIKDDGSLAGPSTRGFWDRVFESSAWPASPEREVARAADGDPLGVVRILELVCPAGCDRERLGAVTLIQREFADPPAEQLPLLLSVGRCRMRYPALALEIERMRLADASVYAQLGSLAFRLEDLDESTRALALVQYQAAVALLSRLRAVGTPASGVRERVDTLAALPVTRNGFEGGLVRWLVQVLAPEEGEPLAEAAARRLAGLGWQSVGQSFEWEELTYRVDIATTEKARIHAALEKFNANTLDTARTFVSLSDQIANGVAGDSLDAFTAAVQQAVTAASEVSVVSWTGQPFEFGSLHDMPGELATALHRGSGDARALERSALVLRFVADLTGADALAALVYALALQDLDGEFALSRELPRRHHLFPQGPARNRGNPWALPAERFPDAGIRYIGGSLLGLEAGVPQLAMRRLMAGRPAEEPNMTPVHANGLLRSAALSAPWTVRAEDLAAIHEAHRRGLEVQQKWTTNGNGEAPVAEAGLSAARAGWARWSRGRRTESVKPSSDLTELVRLGGLRPSAVASWGAAQPLSTCLCLRVPEREWSMRDVLRDPETVAVTLVEPAFRVALELYQRKMPAALAPGVLMLLVTDVIDSAVLPYPTDPRAVIHAVARIPSVRFDDYIAAIAARGPLVRIDDGSKDYQ